RWASRSQWRDRGGFAPPSLLYQKVIPKGDQAVNCSFSLFAVKCTTGAGPNQLKPLLYKKGGNHVRARTVMIQGTASGVGKSFITAALCRIFRQDGRRVAPFKSQNMTSDLGRTPDGNWISRSQLIQARA